MKGEFGRFQDACGAAGPLRLEWDDPATGEPLRREFPRPAVVIGRNREADLVVNHPGIGRRHAYLQLVEGRLFAIDLESRDHLRWEGIPRRTGWLDRGRPVQLGPTTIRLLADDQAGDDDPGAGPGPTSTRYESRATLPNLVLEFRGGDRSPRRRIPVDRVLTLVGRSHLCNLRLPDPGASRFVCALLRTPGGAWGIDLLSSQGFLVNGVACRQARLEDGDVLRIGDETIRLRYLGKAIPSTRPAPASPREPEAAAAGDGSRSAALFPNITEGNAIRPAPGLIPEMILRPLIEMRGFSAEATSDPVGQALLMLVEMLGAVHRDHLALVREELEEIRRLSQEIRALTAQAISADKPALNPPQCDEPALDRDFEGPPQERPDPETVRLIVGERLEAWENERQGRWRKILDLLVTS